MKKHLIYTFVLALSFSISYAQNTQTSPKSIPLIYEKAYLQTDRADYVAGEEIWFKAYLMDGQTNRLSENSNNLYVELISPSAQIISKKVIRLEKGLGDSYFKLLDSIPAGKYNIRAYTNWMKNYSDFFIFNKEINVFQPDQEITTLINDKEKKTAAIKPVQQKPGIAKESIQLFPEGGAMISGVANLVAFKAEDANGKGIAAKGDVVDMNDEIITSFESSNLGMGSFYLAQESGKTYHLKGKFSNGKTFTLPISKALDQGFSIHTQQTANITRIIISTNTATLSNWKGKEFKLLGKSKSKLFYGVKFILDDIKTTIDIENKALIPGINTFTVYDELNKPYAERLIYVDEQNPVKFNLQTNKSSYQAKEQATVKIQLSNIDKQPIKAMLSLAAVDSKIASIPDESIVSYLMLQSEIKGKIEQPEAYFNQADSSRLKNLDLLLLTQGWRDFIWKTLAQTKTVIANMPEQGFNISGKVRQIKADKGIDKANITLSIPGARNQKLFSTVTDSAGRFYFDGISIYGPQAIRLSSRGMKGQNLGWIVLDSLYQPSPKINQLNKDTLQNISPNLLAEIKRRKSITTKLSIKDTISLNEVTVKNKAKNINLWDQSLSSFGYPDQVFNITDKDHDYNNLKHYLLTNVAGALSDPNPDIDGVVFKPSKSTVRPRLIINNRDLSFTSDENDELQNNYYGTYYALQMDKIEKVVVRHMISKPQMNFDEESGMSNMSTMGDVFLIYLTLKPNALERKELDILNAQINGYAAPRTFYAPKYYIKNQTADVRNTIHWEPNITTDEKGEATVTFYNADPSTQIRVVAEGISDTGVPLSAIINYQVK